MLKTYEDIRAFYADVFMQHGDRPAGAAWANDLEHFGRLQLATKAIKLMSPAGIPTRILEIGCGYGVLPLSWAYDGEKIGEYTGVDVTDVYIDRAQFHFYNEPGYVFVNQPIQDFPIVEPYGLTVAIGVIAWQPRATAMEILMKMYEATAPGGLMLFTYLPGEPLAPPEISIFKSMLNVRGTCELSGYAKSGERLVIFKRGAELDGIE